MKGNRHPVSPSMIPLCSVCVWCWEEPCVPLYCRLERDHDCNGPHEIEQPISESNTDYGVHHGL